MIMIYCDDGDDKKWSTVVVGKIVLVFVSLFVCLRRHCCFRMMVYHTAWNVSPIVSFVGLFFDVDSPRS